MKTYKIVYLHTMFISLILAQSSFAEIYEYSDNEGVVHFTDDPQKVPENQRGNVKQTSESSSSTTGNESKTDKDPLGTLAWLKNHIIYYPPSGYELDKSSTKEGTGGAMISYKMKINEGRLLGEVIFIVSPVRIEDSHGDKRVSKFQMTYPQLLMEQYLKKGKDTTGGRAEYSIIDGIQAYTAISSATQLNNIDGIKMHTLQIGSAVLTITFMGINKDEFDKIDSSINAMRIMP